MQKTLIFILSMFALVLTSCNQEKTFTPEATHTSVSEKDTDKSPDPSCIIRCSSTPISNCYASAPITECTSGVRLWKGGYQVDAEDKVYAGVPWRGNAKDWWDNSRYSDCAYRTGTPRVGAIVVFSGSSCNGNYGHVGLVTRINGSEVTMKHRYTGGNCENYCIDTVQEYMESCSGTHLIGYIIYN